MQRDRTDHDGIGKKMNHERTSLIRLSCVCSPASEMRYPEMDHTIAKRRVTSQASHAITVHERTLPTKY